MTVHPSKALILDGYHLVRFIGRGGFGEVWLCRSESMGDYRALKFIPTTHTDRFDKEYEALLQYRKAASRLRSPHLIPIEHANRNDAGLYYVMPLADGVTGSEPADPAWQPLSLAARLHQQSGTPAWFSSQEIIDLIRPVLDALQTLSDAGLVHRDVKPENILFFNGSPCLGDISLLGADASIITRRGTPGYGTPSWYAGGHPDMYGAAATLFHLLTGNPPDKMGRSAFIWPPQGESSLSDHDRVEWKRLHGVIRRATHEKVSERFSDFAAMAANISTATGIGNDPPAKPRLPRILVSVLTVAGVAAATVLAGFRSKQNDTKPETKPAPPQTSTSSQAGKEPAPELTDEQKADYRALAGMIQGYLGEGEYASALASVETLLSTYPQSHKQPAYSIARAMALKGLGRIDEAKAELRKEVHLSPDISTMAARKDLWVEYGDLAEAENDLTRVLKKFGPSTFPLFLRADVRAKRGDFPGVHADRQAAYAVKPEELEMRRLVDTMWAPLESKYPGYGEYLLTLQPDPYYKVIEGAGGTAAIAHDDSWVLDVFDSIMSDIVNADSSFSEDAVRASKVISEESRKSFANRNYAKSLALLDQVLHSLPVLANTPVISLYRSLLLKRLGREKESNGELVKLCHRDSGPRLLDARICLLNALDRRREAEALLTRMIAAIPSSEDAAGKRTLPLLKLRARIRAILSEFSEVRADHAAAVSLIGEETQDSPVRLSIQAEWETLASKYPAYRDYLKTLPEK